MCVWGGGGGGIRGCINKDDCMFKLINSLVRLYISNFFLQVIRLLILHNLPQVNSAHTLQTVLYLKICFCVLLFKRVQRSTRNIVAS